MSKARDPKKNAESRRKYEQSELGKATRKRYQQSEKGKAAARRYRKSVKGRNTAMLRNPGRLSPELEAICREPDRIGILDD